MKRISTLCAALLMAASSFAIPALPIWRLVRQADGTFLKVKAVGDEHFNYCVAQDGIPVVPRGGSYYYAHAKEGRLVASTVLAHEEGLRQGNEAQTAVDMATVRGLEAKALTRSTPFGQPRTEPWAGKKKGLVILVQFQDTKFRNPADIRTKSTSEKDVKTLYDHMLNMPGYKDEKSNAIGSVHDYFLDQSNGTFDLTFDVVGPVTLPQSSEFYGGRTEDSNDKDPAQMIIDACNAVKGQVNFADYDWDGDKEVEQVYVLYAGQGEATGGDPNTIWPHKFALSDAGKSPMTIDGIKINTYACSNEILRADDNGRDRIFYMGIGTICHEFSHCLGLPDFYDTRGGKNVGTGKYDLMSAGSYNGGPASLSNAYEGSGIGTVPAGYNSYEKTFMGWLKPKELKAEKVDVQALKGLAEGGDAYVIYNPERENEYYLLENRSAYRWDKALPKHGLLVLHVDYDAASWAQNTVNAQKFQRHPRFTTVPADNILSNQTEDNDTYPTALNNALTTTSSPALSFYTGYPVADEGGVTGIAAHADGTVSFRFAPLNTSTGIATVGNGAAEPVGFYTLDGTYLGTKAPEASKPQVLIVKDKEGKSRKVVR